jgi:hypothetical protein
MWQPNNQIILWFSKAIHLGGLPWALEGSGGEPVVECHPVEQSQRKSKLGVKTNILNMKFDFLYSKDFKLDTCVFKFTISVGAAIVIAGSGHQKKSSYTIATCNIFPT